MLKRSNCPQKKFSRKTINKISMQLLTPFILQNSKKNSQSRSTVMRMCHFRAQNDPFVLNKFFLVQTIIITFIYLLALFIVQNFKKFLQRFQNYEDASFLGPKWSNCPLKKKIFGKLLISFLSNYQPLSLCKIFKKFFKLIQSYEDAQLLCPKWPISPNENFFRKPVKVALVVNLKLVFTD